MKQLLKSSIAFSALMLIATPVQAQEVSRMSAEFMAEQFADCSALHDAYSDYYADLDGFAKAESYSKRARKHANMAKIATYVLHRRYELGSRSDADKLIGSNSFVYSLMVKMPSETDKLNEELENCIFLDELQTKLLKKANSSERSLY